jgi:parallel beta-helix repeat protein
MMFLKRIFTSFIFCVLLINIIINFQICEFSCGKLLYVGGSGSGNFSIIQNAINFSSDGDTIFVYEEIYYENIEINKSINLVGENKEKTIIKGNNSLNVVTINAPWINLSGFTIQGGPVSGILIEGFDNCNIYKNIIDQNSIGIYIISSSNTKIFNNTILNNSVYGLNITSKQLPSYKLQYNIIFHNNFLNNRCNVLDEGFNNNWSYENEGNYFDDYFGLDKNKDGIGDIPYSIPGGENKDNFPLMMPYSGKIRVKELNVDYEAIYTMLMIGMIIAILFLIPIGYIWYQKTRRVR